MTAMFICAFGMTAFATETEMWQGPLRETWTATSDQIKTVVNNVIFSGHRLGVGRTVFVKVGTAYMDYRKHGQISGLQQQSCLPAWCL